MKPKQSPEKKSVNPAKTTNSTQPFSPEERAAMQARAAELKSQTRRPSNTKEDGEADLLAKIAEMPDHDRALAQRLHAIITTAAPDLSPKTWYGMPAYAKDGNVLCFFQSSHKFKTRYPTLGFSDKANLDEGNLWPTAYALKDLTPIDEASILALLNKALR